MTATMRWPSLSLFAWLLMLAPALALEVRFVPSVPRQGDVVLVSVAGESAARMAGAFGGRPLSFFPLGADQVAVAGVDLEAPAAAISWEISAADGAGARRRATGTLPVAAREFAVQRLTLSPRMVDLDPETERRALAEAARLRAVYATETAERLWSGPFVRPVAGEGSGHGFGARRVINGKPRAPHAGIDFPAATGTPTLASNRGRVVLVGDFFFPGRLVVLDHGLGLHTLYFHLDRVDVAEGALVERGEPIGTVGATGRVTGPHLHFGAQVGPARVDPHLLFTLPVPISVTDLLP
jgi:murein DD-endopeptidase MepM/ murein hydrolase activator NlpD